MVRDRRRLAQWQQQVREHVPEATTMSSHPTTACPTDMGLHSSISTNTASPMTGYDGATYPSPDSSADGIGMASVPAAAAADSWHSLSTGAEWVPSMAAFDDSMCFPDGTTSQFLYDSDNVPSKRVLLNVENFIEAVVSRASCLGRSPCFRPTDIVTAFWESVVDE